MDSNDRKGSISMSIYCTYITFYRGNKLPPFYIGSTSVDRVNSGYKGSVVSRAYKDLWKSELRKNSYLFKTKVISTHLTRKDALAKEEKLQRSLNVIKNPLYTNKSYATTGCFGDSKSGTKQSKETIDKITKALLGKKRTPEQCKRIGDSKRGISQSAESNKKRSVSLKGRSTYIRSAQHKKNISERQLGQTLKVEHKKKIAEGLKKYWYHTPFGITDDPRNFKHIISYTTVRKWCLNPEEKPTAYSFNSSQWLKTNHTWDDLDGKTFKELGFFRTLKV